MTRDTRPTTRRARGLRRRSTRAESILWWRLRARQLGGWKFRRQQPVGPFIADFCCLEARLIVEVDGGHHAEEERQAADRHRTEHLERLGYRVLRFWDHDALARTDAVLIEIARSLPPHPDPLPEGEGVP